MRALLFSGGIDSTALAFAHAPDLLVFVDYGQLAAAGERRAARSITDELGLTLQEIVADLSSLGSGTMSSRPAASQGPPEHWPLRNQALVTLAAMRNAGVVDRLMIGSVAGDEAHDDGTPEFRDAMNALLAVQRGPMLEAPAAGMTTEQLLRRHCVPETLIGWTFSCHVSEWACGTCRGCSKHRRVVTDVYGSAG